MCGICGIAGFDSNRSYPGFISSMASILRHRGPDDEGYVAVSTSSGTVTPLSGNDSQVQLPSVKHFSGDADVYLAHRRLAIIDLSPAGHQPMGYDDGHIWVVYNGELYNHQQLRSELEKMGCQFRTRTDTEVLLAAYRQWGEGCLERFDGMWAFVLYDKRRNALFGSRDRFGVKPLYIMHNKVFFAFASETKAFNGLPEFNRTINDTAVFDYLAFGQERWDDGTTFFKDVQEIPASGTFWFDLANSKFRLSSYYTLPCNDNSDWESYNEKKAVEHVENVREHLQRSVLSHLVSDVPVGSCLSGGIDSSVIVGTVASVLDVEAMGQVGARPKTFTACYGDPGIDESAWAKLVAQHSNAEGYRVYPKEREVFQDLEDLVYVQDFPFGSTSIYAQYRVMKLARESGVTVLLDGQGADELFSGYMHCYPPFFTDMLRHGAWKDLSREWSGLVNSPTGRQRVVLGYWLNILKNALPFGLKKKLWERYIPLAGYLAPSFRAQQYDRSFDRYMTSRPDTTSLDRILRSQISGSLQTLLRYEDRNSMRFQIESRTPFADDRQLIEAVFAIPSVYKIHDGRSKWLLREAARPVLPKRVYRRVDKIGFATPEYHWLSTHQDEFKKMILAYAGDFVDKGKIQQSWGELLSCQPTAGVTPLWRLVNMAVWMKSASLNGQELVAKH